MNYKETMFSAFFDELEKIAVKGPTGQASAPASKGTGLKETSKATTRPAAATTDGLHINKQKMSANPTQIASASLGPPPLDPSLGVVGTPPAVGGIVPPPANLLAGARPPRGMPTRQGPGSTFDNSSSMVS